MAGVAVARVGLALLSSDLRRLAIGAIGALFLASVAIVFVIVALLKSLFGFAGASASLGLLPGTGGAPGPLASGIPGDQLAFMQQVAASSPCGVPWSVFAGVAFVESDFGTNLGPSSAGAYGYGQFMPGTWPSYSDGVPWRTYDPAQLALPNCGPVRLEQFPLRRAGHGSLPVRNGGLFRCRVPSGGSAQARALLLQPRAKRSL